MIITRHADERCEIRRQRSVAHTNLPGSGRFGSWPKLAGTVADCRDHGQSPAGKLRSAPPDGGEGTVAAATLKIAQLAAESHPSHVATVARRARHGVCSFESRRSRAMWVGAPGPPLRGASPASGISSARMPHTVWVGNPPYSPRPRHAATQWPPTAEESSRGWCGRRSASSLEPALHSTRPGTCM